jgi:hypothetical protein
MEEQIRIIARAEAEKVFASLFPQSLKPNPQQEYVSMKSFQRDYGISAPTAYRHVNNGHLSLVKLGGKSFLKKAEVDKLFIKVK